TNPRQANRRAQTCNSRTDYKKINLFHLSMLLPRDLGIASRSHLVILSEAARVQASSAVEGPAVAFAVAYRNTRYHGDIVPVISLKTPSAAYDITIASGLLRTLSARLNKLAKGRRFIVTSPEIWGLWHKQVLASFKEAPTVLFLPSGEAHKRLTSVESLAQQLSTAGADRDSLLIAFGGGVIGDVT